MRTGAALALACRERLSGPLTRDLALLAARDPEPAVLRAADLARHAGQRCDRWAPVFAPPGAAGPWVALRLRDRPILAPAETLGALRLTWGPGFADATAVASTFD